MNGISYQQKFNTNHIYLHPYLLLLYSHQVWYIGLSSGSGGVRGSGDVVGVIGYGVGRVGWSSEAGL